MFVDRATAARSDFRLTDANAAAIVAICARLDGLPLAIELAAARVRLLPPEAILTRLGGSLDLLDRGGRDLPARQQTLRGAIGWSHDLLDEPTRRLFARLSVFAGGARLDAIESVCGPAGDLGTDVLGGLEDLVDQSLVQGAEVHGEARYSMLQTIHGYAAERLAASDEIEAIRRRHAKTYLDLAERAAPELIGSDQRTWLDLLEQEHDNVGAAIDYAVATSETELALRLVAAPWRFWQMRGSPGRGSRPDRTGARDARRRGSSCRVGACARGSRRIALLARRPPCVGQRVHQGPRHRARPGRLADSSPRR